MVISLIDRLIPKGKLTEKHDLFTQRCFIAIMLLMFSFAFASFITKRLTNYEDPFPFWLIIILIPILLFVNKGMNKTVIAINVFNGILFIILAVLMIETGGIFSMNTKWLLIILFLSLLYLPITQMLVWMGLSLALLCGIYWGVDVDVTSIPGFDKNTYLIDCLLFITMISIFFAIFYRFQTLLRENIDRKKQASERQTEKLRLQAEKIEEVSKQLEESNQQLKNYAHTTSHDLRQPLRTISSFVQLMQKDIEQNKVTDATKEYMAFVLDASRKGNRLVDDILVHAQVEHLGKETKELISTDFLLKNVTRSLKRQIEETKAEITVANKLPAIYGNPIEIERVFQNLISNALKYAKENMPPQLNISCITDSTSHTFLIEDKGIGIQKENLLTIFDRFVQEKRANKFGQGIGLANCKSIIENHGGKIWIESELDQYTRMFFTIPKMVK